MTVEKAKQMAAVQQRTDLDLTVRTIIAAFACVLVVLLFYLQYDFYMENGNEYINTSDNDYYSDRINRELSGSFSIGDVNNLPLIYLYKFIQFSISTPVDRMVFVVNIFYLLLSYVMLERVHFAAAGRYIPLHFAIGLLPLVAYIPLINKDGITTLFYCSLVHVLYFGTKGSLAPLLLSMLVRVQSPLVAVLAWAQTVVSQDYRLRAALLLAAYSVVSLASAFLQNTGRFLDMNTVTGSALGLSQLRYDLDYDFYIGSFLTNFLLPLKYIYDTARSIYVDGSPLSIIIAVGRVCFLMIFGRYLFMALKLLYMPWSFVEGPLVLISSVVSSFLIVWMLSPVVHYRYFVSIIPIIVLGLSLMECTGEDRPGPGQALPEA
jgi:hypothetical protein